MTQLLSIHQPEAVAQALALLGQEQIIAAPTDTVYGLMAVYTSSCAIERLYEAKDRPPHKAIPVLISDLTQLAHLTPLPIDPLAQRLIERFWPGPLTLVLSALPSLPALLTAGQPTVAIRMPDHAALRQLIARSGPLAATSANRSGAPDARCAAEVLQQLAGRIPLLLADDPKDAQPADVTLPSTIVDLSQLTTCGPRILRSGALDDALADLLLNVHVDRY
jgi:L-threonylcarbamoyladenylate synthase